jgi:cytochrome c oxidase cbb3-type subunit III
MANKLLRQLFFFILIIFSAPAIAQPNASSQGIEFDYLTTVMVFVLVIAILVLVVAIYLLYVVRLLVQKTQTVVQQEKTESEIHLPIAAPKAEKRVWAQLSSKMTKAVPISEEDTILLDHDYDGIKELDNHLPPWWKGLFYFTIAFSVVYLLVYHVIKPEWAPLQDEAYALEMKRFEEQRSQLANFIDEGNVELTLLTEDLENGKQIYLRNCAACHRADGGGSIGPNLTDEYWIHGNGIQDVFKVVKYGISGKMLAWESTLSGKDMRDVSSYVLNNLVGSNPDNPKEPEGEPVELNLQSDAGKTIESQPFAAILK